MDYLAPSRVRYRTTPRLDVQDSKDKGFNNLEQSLFFLLITAYHQNPGTDQSTRNGSYVTR